MIARIEDAVRQVRPGAARPLHMIFRYGGSAPSDTSQAIVLGRDGGPVAVVKIGRGAAARAALAREHARLEGLSRSLLPRWPGAVPEPLTFENDGEVALLVESHLPGRRLKDIDPRAVHGDPAILERIVDWLLAFTLAAGIERVDVDTVVLQAHVARPVTEYHRAFEISPPERVLLDSLADRLRDSLGARVPLVAAHGDLTDANILVHESSVGVVDWDEPFDRTLPGFDLFYLLCSLVATRSGLGRREAFERGFAEAFFGAAAEGTPFRDSWARYREALELPASAGLPLFALAWVRFALHKLRYLEASGELAGRGPGRLRALANPQASYPVTFFHEGRCLNLSLTAERADAFAL